MIEVKNLTKSFNDVKAVDDISFTVSKGEIVGLLGPNGAGKTTTMRMLTAFLKADGGEVTIGGYSVQENPLEVKKLIGYLPENAPIYEDMIVEDYLNFAGEARGIATDDLEESVKRMVKLTSLTSHLKKNINQLSKGFRQRVGLAATMIHNPDILILDEPTTGLDPNQILEIRKLIIELGKEKTVILSTHIMQEVEETCTRVLIIADGKMLADDSVSAIRSSAEGKIETIVYLKADGNFQDELKNQSYVKGLEPLPDSDGNKGVKILSTEPIGEQLFKLAVEKGWVLADMKIEKQNLESVFRELTNASTADTAKAGVENTMETN